MGNCLGQLRKFIRQYSQQDDLCLRRKPFLNAKAARKFNFSRKDPPKNMPRYKNLSEFSARNSGNMREKNGEMSGNLSQQELPHQCHTRTLCTETVSYYIPAHLPPPNSSAEFENNFIAYIESEHDSLRLFLSKESKPNLSLRKSLGKMWKTSLNNIPPSSQNPSKNITCSVVITPPRNRDFIRFHQAPLWGKEWESG